MTKEFKNAAITLGFTVTSAYFGYIGCKELTIDTTATHIPVVKEVADSEEADAAFNSNDEAFTYYKDLVENLDVSTAKNQATFYSGPGNRQLAEQFAKANGKMTLELTPGGKYLDSLKLFEEGSPLTGPQAAEVWSRLSQRYAQQASGNAYGFVQGARPGSIFNTVEYPALQNNKNIVNVFTELFK